MSAPEATRETFELAARLIATPSANPPGDERAMASVLRDAIHERGLPAPREIARDPRRPNLMSTLDFGEGGRHLLLCGHMDTKPLGDAAWDFDPFAGTVSEGRLIGLGAVDMKGALAALLTAAAQLAADPPAAGRVTLLFCADEENGSAFGARHVAGEASLRPDGVVIAEPGGIREDFDRLHLVSRGIARGRLRARARQGHSSLREELAMRNAGADLAAAVLALDGRPIDPPVPPADIAGWQLTVNAGLRYDGGLGFGVLPEWVAADWEVRLLPGVERPQLTGALEDALAGVAADRGADLALEWDQPPTDWLPSTFVPRSDPLVLAASRAWVEVLGTAPTYSVFPGTTDASWLAGEGEVPVLPAYGPGLLASAHARNEWVSLVALDRAVDLYTHLAREYCAG